MMHDRQKFLFSSLVWGFAPINDETVHPTPLPFKLGMFNYNNYTVSVAGDTPIGRYKKYLQQHYAKYAVAPDDILTFITPSSKFITLALVDKNKSVNRDDPFTATTLHGGVDEIRAHKMKIEMNDILPAGTRFVLIEGSPGSGKSTLSWELCRKWKDLASLQHFNIVLLLRLRDEDVQNFASLSDLFDHVDQSVCQGVMEEVGRSDVKVFC